jgi:hypothetical protein
MKYKIQVSIANRLRYGKEQFLKGFFKLRIENKLCFIFRTHDYRVQRFIGSTIGMNPTLYSTTFPVKKDHWLGDIKVAILFGVCFTIMNEIFHGI